MGRFAQAVAWIIVGGAVLVVAFMAYSVWTRHGAGAARQAANEASAAAVRSGDAAGHDATTAVQGEAATEAQIRAQTEASTDAIEHAKGAQAPVDPALYARALHEHCLRDSAKHDPACLKLQHAGP